MNTIMMVMNERKYAESVLNGTAKRMLKNPQSTLNVLAKYYFSEGFDRSKINENLQEYIDKNHLASSQDQSKSMISIATKNLGKYPIVEIDEIPISKPEMDNILNIKSMRYKAYNAKTLQKLAFSLLCLGKFQLLKGRNEPWVNIDIDKLFKIANIDCSSRETQIMHLIDLKDLGLIEVTSSASDSSFKVLYIEQGATEITVCDINECGKVYEQYLGTPYVRCEYCGGLTRVKSNRTKYCNDCYKQINREQTVQRMRERRASLKT